MVTLESLYTLPGGSSGVLFRDIHIGLDNSEGFFHYGHRYHPCVMSGGGSSALFRNLSASYQQFQKYVHQFYSHSSSPRGVEPVQITFVQRALSLHKSLAGEVPSVTGRNGERASNRLILNVDSLANLADGFGHKAITLNLENTPFHTQLQLLYSTDVLVATAGSALHNSLFMRRGSSIVIIMQKSWQQWSWAFVNQALLLDMRVFVYVDNFKPPKGYQCLTAHWSRLFWRVGPRAAKSANIHVDEDVFSLILREAGDFSEGGEQKYAQRANYAEDLCSPGVRTFYKQGIYTDEENASKAFYTGCRSQFDEFRVPLVRVLVSYSSREAP